MGVKKSNDVPETHLEEVPDYTGDEALVEEPGFYVNAGSARNGPYATEADAQAYIDGQITPQGIDASIDEVE